jgi:hypothetical protein
VCLDHGISSINILKTSFRYEPGTLYGAEAWRSLGPCEGGGNTRSINCPAIFDKYLVTYTVGDQVSSRDIIFECITSNGRYVGHLTFHCQLPDISDTYYDINSCFNSFLLLMIDAFKVC